MPYYYWDPTYILVLIGALLSVGASALVNRTFNRYSSVYARSGLTGAQAAQKLLHSQGIYDVQIQHISGSLTDHYDPRNKTLSLSDAVYNATTVAAIGVAAHECGHAMQHAKGYVPLSIRSCTRSSCQFWFLICHGPVNCNWSFLLTVPQAVYF